MQAEIARRYLDQFDLHNGYLIGDIGNYGTDYTLRALTDRIGVGALKPKIAIYAFTQTANDLSPLVGSSRYVLHIPADQLADPRRAFWSVTLYDTEIFLFANPIDRYLINDRSEPAPTTPTARSTSTSRRSRRRIPSRLRTGSPRPRTAAASG